MINAVKPPLRERILDLYRTKVIDVTTLEELIGLLGKAETFGGKNKSIAAWYVNRETFQKSGY